MDLVAPNPAIMGTGFMQLGVIVVALLVRAIATNEQPSGLLFRMKMNKPLTAILFGEFWALAAWGLYRIGAVSGGMMAVDDYFVAGVWLAGASSLGASIVKDMRDGSITAADELDVIAMRRENPKHGGIGS